MNRQTSEWENIFGNDTSDKRLISKTYKELNKTQHQKNQTIQFKKRQRNTFWVLAMMEA